MKGECNLVITILLCPQYFAKFMQVNMQRLKLRCPVRSKWLNRIKKGRKVAEKKKNDESLESGDGDSFLNAIHPGVLPIIL